MAGFVAVKTQARSVGLLGLTWNRLTPTRGERNVTQLVTVLGKGNSVRLQVGSQAILVNNILPAEKNGYHQCLRKSGIVEIVFPRGTSQVKAKRILDALSDRTLPKIGKIMEEEGITLLQLTNSNSWLEYAKHKHLNEGEVAEIIANHLPKSGSTPITRSVARQLSQPEEAALGKDPASGPPTIEKADTIVDYQSYYTDEDLDLAREIIRAHPADRQLSIMEELFYLNRVLAERIGI